MVAGTVALLRDYVVVQNVVVIMFGVSCCPLMQTVAPVSTLPHFKQVTIVMSNANISGHFRSAH